MDFFASRSLCCYNLIKLVYIVTKLCSKQIKQFKICMTVSVSITRKSVSCKNELNVVDFTASDYSDGVFKHFWCLMLGIVCIVPLVRPDKHKMQIAEFSFKCVVRNLSVLFSNSYAISICKTIPPFTFYGNLHDRNGMVWFFLLLFTWTIVTSSVHQHNVRYVQSCEDRFISLYISCCFCSLWLVCQ